MPITLSFLEKNASRIFWVFALLHVVCWTVLPTLVQPNAPLDVVEGFVWGREGQWGYYKHPPLQAWLLEAATYITGTSGIGYFGLSALCVGVALWAVYRTGRLFTSNAKALIAAMLCQGILYFNFLATEFNPNVLQLMTWALCSYAFAHALLREKLKYWLLLGVFFALGFYAKYAIALLGIGFFIFLLMQNIRGFLDFKPYLALLICVLLLSPHLIWLWQHDFLPFSYAVSRSEEAKDLLQRMTFPLKFTAAQFADMVSMLAMVMLIVKPNGTNDSHTHIQQRLLFTLAFAPLILNIVLSLITGHKPLDMWGMPYLSFIPLWLITRLKTDFSPQNLFTLSIALPIVFVLGLAAFYVQMVVTPQLGFKPLRGHFPGAELSRQMHKIWQEKTGAPLTTIISDAWLGGNVALYAPDIRTRPHVFIDGNPKISPWIDEGVVKTKGALVLWNDSSPRPAMLPEHATVQSVEIPWQAATKAQAPRIFYAILAPQP